MEELVRQHLNAGRLTEAFEILVQSLQHKVFRLAFSLLHDEGLAEDAAQDAFLRVWRALPDFEGRSSVSTWIYTITRNVCLSRAKLFAAERRMVAARIDPATEQPDRSPVDLQLALSLAGYRKSTAKRWISSTLKTSLAKRWRACWTCRWPR